LYQAVKFAEVGPGKKEGAAISRDALFSCLGVEELSEILFTRSSGFIFSAGKLTELSLILASEFQPRSER